MSRRFGAVARAQRYQHLFDKDEFFATQGGMLLIPTTQHWFLDWQTYEAPVVTDTALEVGIRGIMFDDFGGEAEWSTDFTTMPYKDTTQPAQFQAYLDNLSVDSLLGSWLEVGDVAGWVYGD